MATKPTSGSDVPFTDPAALDEALTRIRDLNERVMQSAKTAGTVSLDAYEKALKSLVEFEEKVASASQLDWVSAIATTQATFVQDASNAYIKAARELLK